MRLVRSSPTDPRFSAGCVRSAARRCTPPVVLVDPPLPPVCALPVDSLVTNREGRRQLAVNACVFDLAVRPNLLWFSRGGRDPQTAQPGGRRSHGKGQSYSGLTESGRYHEPRLHCRARSLHRSIGHPNALPHEHIICRHPPHELLQLPDREG